MTVLVCLGFSPVYATTVKDSFNDNLNKVSDTSDYEAINNPNNSLPLYIGGLIAWTSFLGIIMIIQIILGGYEYMTAHDSADKIASAKKRIRNAIYAAIILAGGYVLAATVVNLSKMATVFKG